MSSTILAPRMAHDIIGNIGNTPLLRVAKIARDLPGIEIYAKAEYFNPGGSVKDRAALNMIAAAKGFKVKLCLPANASMERKRILKAYGAEVVLTPADEGSDGAIRKCREIYASDPNRYFYAAQY